MSLFANYTPTPEFWALLGIIVTGLGRWWWQASKERSIRLSLEAEREQKLKEREEDRKDLIAAAEAAATLNAEQLKPVIEQLDALDKAGTNRLKALLNSNVTTRLYTKKAIDTANGVNEKIQALSQAIVDSKDIPQQVEVINTEEHPVQTHNVDNEK